MIMSRGKLFLYWNPLSHSKFKIAADIFHQGMGIWLNRLFASVHRFSEIDRSTPESASIMFKDKVFKRGAISVLKLKLVLDMSKAPRSCFGKNSNVHLSEP